MILTHPCTDQFDREHHAPYVEFFHNLLPETRDAMELHKKHESKFAANPAYVQMYRTGHAYHPAHPFFMWYWGEAGRQWLGKVIVVGADNAYAPKLLGWETATSMNEALEMAKGNTPSPEITLLHMPPIVMTEVTLAPPIPHAAPKLGGGGESANGHGSNGHIQATKTTGG